jgi:hypothetical protein
MLSTLQTCLSPGHDLYAAKQKLHMMGQPHVTFTSPYSIHKMLFGCRPPPPVHQQQHSVQCNVDLAGCHGLVRVVCTPVSWCRAAGQLHARAGVSAQHHESRPSPCLPRDRLIPLHSNYRCCCARLYRCFPNANGTNRRPRREGPCRSC